jgi:tryptophan halogenase
MNIQKTIIVGGGTAGLISALMLNRTYPLIKIQVIESNNIGIIGVGEGTTAHWSQFVQFCNINMADLIKESDATYKIGIKFNNWYGDGKSYLHSLVSPLVAESDYLGYPYIHSVLIKNNRPASDLTLQQFLNKEVPDYFSHDMHLAYHFNTHKLNTYLHRVAEDRGIEFIKTDLVTASVSESGIESVTNITGNTYFADFFIDCSGFSKFLCSKLGAKWVDYKKYLPMNHAIAFPTEKTEENLPVLTESTALSSGWSWKIPTYERFGNGYVFNDAYISADQAKDEIEQLYGHEVNIAKDIKFGAGKLDQFWIKNCVGIGLSGAFVEPLEATSIGFTILQMTSLLSMMIYWERSPDYATKKFNKTMDESFDNIVDFIQLHYFTKRNDSKFWKELDFTVTDFNKETLNIFKKSLPTREIFEYNTYRMFSHNHWSQVMIGLDLFDRDSISKNLEKFVTAEEFFTNELTNAHDRQALTKTIRHIDFLNRYRN